jgi:hypothetical protein
MITIDPKVLKPQNYKGIYKVPLDLGLLLCEYDGCEGKWMFLRLVLMF